MNIALLAPPYLPVPPTGYGGTEKIISLLADGLVDRGHDVTLFASGESVTKANLHAYIPKAIGNSGDIKNKPLIPLLCYTECFRRAHEFDIIHNHAQYLPMFLAEYCPVPVVHTIHGSFYEDEVPEEKRDVLRAFAQHHFISISDAQREGLDDLNFAGTVYNSLNITEYPFLDHAGRDYLLWVGRITRKKGPEDAIAVAKALAMPLILAAVVDPTEQVFYDTYIAPHVDGSTIQFSNELSLSSLTKLYQNAACTLFPVTWHEPFGLVMIESMACGTPVVGYGWGSVPEVITDRETGYIVQSEETPIVDKKHLATLGNLAVQKKGVPGLIEAVEKIRSMTDADYEAMRKRCRTDLEKRFTVPRMVEAYENAYKKILTGTVPVK